MVESTATIGWHAEDGVGQLTLKRPPLNVLNLSMLRELEAALKIASSDSTLRVLVLRAEGKMFSAGVDVADHTADKVGEMIPLFDRICAALAAFPAPMLAVVQGHALGGGCELVLCCDLVVAAEEAKLGQPEIKLAAVAPVAALLLPGQAGLRRAAEMLFTGDTITAVEAARIGLINRAVPAAELERIADEITAKLQSLSAAALRLLKRAMRTASAAADWESMPEVEKLYLKELEATEDAHEGLSAFLEKRAPVWKHR